VSSDRLKGKATFTQQEAAELRRLIAEKQIADRSRQKTIRAQMRAIGFYITDFTTYQRGFVVSDFDDLVTRGVIAVVAGDTTVGSSSAGSHAAAARTSPKPANDESKARARRELAAREYKPDPVDLLLAAEAPPSALERYFYFSDVREQDSLFRYVCRVLLDREPTREGKGDLLAELRDRGVFLIDLQQEPRDGTPLSEFVPELVERCERLNPGWIVLIKTTVFDAAYPALALAGLPVSAVRVPFPGSGQQRRFLEAFGRAREERRNTRTG
jgi:hypothetical protein